MEVSGAVLRRLPCFSGTGIDAQSHSKQSKFHALTLDSGNRFSGSLRLKKFCGALNYEFRDNGHVEYYSGLSSTIRCGGVDQKKKEKGTDVVTMKKLKKKKMKLLKALSRDITEFSGMGFGLDSSDLGLAGEVKGKMISDAAELLLAQLQKLKAAKKELKRKKKLDKSKMKAREAENRPDCVELSSSSSSSESSDSECGEVVDMSRLKGPVRRDEPSLALLTTTPTALKLQPVAQEAGTSTLLPSLPPKEEEGKDGFEERGFGLGSNILEQPAPGPAATTTISSCCRSSIVGSTSTCCNDGVNNLAATTTRDNAAAEKKKIEVCMGGKCKKSGAAALLEQFQRIVGVEGAVVGCKCMGKCRDGPNVRVLNHLDRRRADGVDDDDDDDDSVTAPSNPLCIGVGFEDVDLIVSNFFGKKAHQDFGVAAAASASS